MISTESIFIVNYWVSEIDDGFGFCINQKFTVSADLSVLSSFFMESVYKMKSFVGLLYFRPFQGVF